MQANESELRADSTVSFDLCTVLYLDRVRRMIVKAV